MSQDPNPIPLPGAAPADPTEGNPLGDMDFSPEDLQSILDDEPEEQVLGRGRGTSSREFFGMGGGLEEPAFDHVEVPMFQAVNLEGVAQGLTKLHVKRMTLEGAPESLGYMQATAGEYALAKRYGAGDYIVMPVDEFGNQLSAHGKRVTLPGDHPAFRDGKAAAGKHGGTVGGVADHTETWMGAVERERGRTNEMTDRMMSARDGFAKEQLESAGNMFGKVLDMQGNRASETTQMQTGLYNQMMEMQRQSGDSTAKAQEGMFGSVIAMMQTSGQQQMMMMQGQMQASAAQAAANLAAQQQWSQQQMQMQEAAARGRESDRRAIAEEQRTSAASRRIEEQRAELARSERENTRSQEHMLLMVNLIEKNAKADNPMAGIMTAALAAGPILGFLGIEGGDIKEMVQNTLMGGGGGGGGGIASEIGETLRELIRVIPEMQPDVSGFIEAATQQREQPEEEEEYDDEELDGMLDVEGEDDKEEEPEPEHLDPQIAQTPMARLAAARAAAGATGQIKDRSPAPAAGIQTPVIPEATLKAGQETVGNILEVLAQAKNRRGLRAKIKKAFLAGNPRETVAYLQAATIRGAARQAGADEALIETFVAELQKEPLASTLPMGE